MQHQPLTEDRLIRAILNSTKRRGRVQLGIGDDAAILHDGTVVTTDAYAEDVHFSLEYMTLRQVGERCACGAISDVVAMAAEPDAVFVSLALPRRQLCARNDVMRQVRQLYAGIDRACRDMRCEVAGGDIIVADKLLLALTVTGRTRTPRLRSGARPGDKLYVTGCLGSADAGRIVLAERAAKRSSDARLANRDWRSPLVRRHLRPIPRLEVMKALRRSVHGLIDTSDGLATDAKHLSEMSGVRITLDADALPISAATERFCVEHSYDPVDFVLGAGEDYELLFSSARELPRQIAGIRLAAIGWVERGKGLWIRRPGGTDRVVVSGYDHLRQDHGKTCD